MAMTDRDFMDLMQSLGQVKGALDYLMIASPDAHTRSALDVTTEILNDAIDQIIKDRFGARTIKFCYGSGESAHDGQENS